MFNSIFSLIFFLSARAFFLPIAEGFLAYDCAHERINVTKVSLSSIQDCQRSEQAIHEDAVDVEIIQVDETLQTHVVQCKIEVIQTIMTCGSVFSYNKMVQGGLSQYLASITSNECYDLHKYKSYSYKKNGVISGLKLNGTIIANVVIAGSVDNSGKCSGSSFSYAGRNYDDVVVQHAVSVTLIDYSVTAWPKEDRINLRSGKICSYKAGECMDTDIGHTTWRAEEKPSCLLTQYNAIYQGPANRTYLIKDGPVKPVFTVMSEGILLSLSGLRSTTACGYPAFQSEHPQLLIVPKVASSFLFSKRGTNQGNFDIFTYMNSKFVYIERHIQKQMKNLYQDIIEDRCKKEKQILETQLAVGINHPEEFAKLYMKSEGYTAINAGSVVHIIQCQAVDVKVREDTECWVELPVTYKGRKVFMSPHSHIIKEKGTPMTCNSLMPSMFKINNNWYATNGGLIKAEEPHEMNPNEGAKWSYQSPGDLATQGLVAYDDIVAMNRMIMFHVNKESMITSVAYEGSSKGYQFVQVDLSAMLDEKKIQTMFDHAAEKTWKTFKDFGSISAGVFMIYFIFTKVLSIIGILLRCKTRYDETGFSWRMMAAMWNDLSYYWDQRAHKKGSWKYQQDNYISKKHKHNDALLVIDPELTEKPDVPDPSAPQQDTTVQCCNSWNSKIINSHPS